MGTSTFQPFFLKITFYLNSEFVRWHNSVLLLNESLPPKLTMKEYKITFCGCGDVTNAWLWALQKINENPEFIEKMEPLGFSLLFWGPEEYDKKIEERTKFYQELLAEYGFKK